MANLHDAPSSAQLASAYLQSAKVNAIPTNIAADLQITWVTSSVCSYPETDSSSTPTFWSWWQLHMITNQSGLV
jgi:hypothetical protein